MMQTGKASGFQIAFFIFAVFLLTVPLAKFVSRRLELEAGWFELLTRIGQLAILAILIFTIEMFRRGVVSRMLRPIPHERRVETTVVAALELLGPFAFYGAIAAGLWIAAGPLAVEQRFPTDVIHTAGEAHFFSAAGLVMFFAAVTIAPLVEEVAFRGLLYNAWERAWGWFPAMIATAVVFGLYHASFTHAFLASILWTCLYRRTGTLVAPITLHAISNAAVHYPLLGQFHIPRPELAAGYIGSWALNLFCLLVVAIALPLYIFMARNPYPREEE